MRAAPIALLAAALFALAPGTAQGGGPWGDPPPQIAIRLSYILGPGTKSCPSEQTLHDEVARRMGYDPFTPDAADRVVTTLSLSPRSARATVEFYDTGDHRWDDKTFTIPDNNCMALVTGIAIYISYMFAPFALPPSAAAPPAPPEPAPPEPAPLPLVQAPAPSPMPPQKAEPRPSPPPSEPLRLNLGIASALALRTASRPFAFNLAAGAGLRYRSFSGALEFRWTPPEVAVVDTTGRALVHVTQYAGGVLLCGHYRALVYCGVGQVIAVVAKGAPDVEPQSLTMGTVAAGARLGGDLPLPLWGRRIAVRLSADVLVTPGDVAIGFGDAMSTTASPAHLAWSMPRLTTALGVGFVTDLRLK